MERTVSAKLGLGLAPEPRRPLCLRLGASPGIPGHPVLIYRTKGYFRHSLPAAHDFPDRIHIFLPNLTSWAGPFHIWLQSLLWGLLGNQQRVVLIIADSWKVPKITWPRRRGGARQSSEMTFLLHSIPGLEFQFPIKRSSV